MTLSCQSVRLHIFSSKQIYALRENLGWRLHYSFWKNLILIHIYALNMYFV